MKSCWLVSFSNGKKLDKEHAYESAGTTCFDLPNSVGFLNMRKPKFGDHFDGDGRNAFFFHKSRLTLLLV